MFYRVAFEGTNLIKMSLVIAAAMLAMCLLALVETTNTVEATSLPENGKIAFSIYRDQDYRSDIYTVDTDGSNLSRLTKIANSTYHPQLAWSPDGTKLAFSTFENEERFWVIDADGSNLRVLAPNTSELSDDSDPAWSPDGKKLAFTGFSEPNSLGTADIYTMDVDGSNINNVTKNPGVFEGGIDFSPDGSQMCLSRSIQEVRHSFRELRKDGLYVMNADASNPTQVTNRHASGCAWSPDGKKIAYTYEQPKQRGATIQDFDVYVMNPDGSEKANLTSNRNWDAKPLREAEANPEWSPDGRRIAFTSNRDGDLDGTYNSDIYTMDADGSDVVQVTKTPSIDESIPDWQPLTPKSRSLTVLQPDTGGTSLLLVASALLFSSGVMFYAGLKRRM